MSDDARPRSGPASRSAAEAKRFRYVRAAIVLTFTVVIAFLALRTSPYLQYISWMPRRVGVWADHNGIVRNTVAFFGFSLVVLGLLGARVAHVLAICAFGTAIEVAQLWIPGRTFDWRDIAASVAGVVLAWPVAGTVRRLVSAR
jgi:VanZ family protein